MFACVCFRVCMHACNFVIYTHMKSVRKSGDSDSSDSDSSLIL
jgi:hypothetical protein